MKRFFLFSLAFINILLANETDRLAHKFNYETRTSKYKDFNIPKVAEVKEQSTEKYKNVKYTKNTNVDAEKTANDIKKYVSTNEFKTKLEKQTKYILDDEQLGYKQELKKQKEDNDSILKNKIKSILDPNEKIYIAISSSMNKSLIRNYVKQVYPFRNEVIFILRGTIPEKDNPNAYGHKKIKPTLKYIRDILKNDGTQLEANITIDPKTFQKFNITSVPAFLYVKDILAKKSEYIKIYGAVHIKLSIKKTLEQMNSQNLIKIQKNFL